MFPPLHLRGRPFEPPLFCAPMAGVTHCAFRRLVADFGGYGALFTEMLYGPALLRETFANSPYVRRRAEEGAVFYQLLVGAAERLDPILARLRSFEPAGVDINLGCGARDARRTGGGSALFRDADRMARVLTAVRQRWDGPLTVKIRLGWERDGWEEDFVERVRRIVDSGVDAVILHPRFVGEKFRRHARIDRLAWAVRVIRLPVILSGDITAPDSPPVRKAAEAGVAGVMIGRMAAVQPWFFAKWAGQNPDPDLAEVWTRFVRYVEEDFPPNKRLSRVKIFTEYFSRNFRFGHRLFARVQSARSLEEAQDRADEFFRTSPDRLAHPSVLGIS